MLNINDHENMKSDIVDSASSSNIVSPNEISDQLAGDELDLLENGLNDQECSALGGNVLSDDDEQAHYLREQDRYLPIANVAKLMKKAIPQSGKIAKDAKECVQECVSEFISFITSEAAERCYIEKRKTINGDDILAAMSILGFEAYIQPLKIFLQKYRESVKCEVRSSTNEEYEQTDVQASNQFNY